ncbi:hypothetical protein CEXT_623441 [Caerostris extrusa]|uniref:Uncharacterized protein n=1 Tax=Caerostris extrusa TaxID=172846 RepID=A0AAV4P0K3_CAEEX|nr:hypothetical protein CEXT_623441 [Caerostris extrusa]
MDHSGRPTIREPFLSLTELVLMSDDHCSVNNGCANRLAAWVGLTKYHPIILSEKFQQSNNFPTLLGLDWNPKLGTTLRANRITPKPNLPLVMTKIQTILIRLSRCFQHGLYSPTIREPFLSLTELVLMSSDHCSVNNGCINRLADRLAA